MQNISNIYRNKVDILNLHYQWRQNRRNGSSGDFRQTRCAHRLILRDVVVDLFKCVVGIEMSMERINAPVRAVEKHDKGGNTGKCIRMSILS